jgi:hypothetical protein
MKTLPYPLISLLLGLMLIFAACEPEVQPTPDPIIYTYKGEVTHTFNHYRRYPDGRDTTISRTETSVDSFSIKKVGELTYEIVAYESGCALTFHGIYGPCPGIEFTLSEDLHTYWGWDYDDENDIDIQFSSDTTEVDIKYTYSDGYLIPVYDVSGIDPLYEKIDTEAYFFKGIR